MNYVTPTNYLELVQGYMKMLKARWHWNHVVSPDDSDSFKL